MNQKDALRAFRAADFNWATQLQDVWSDPVCDVPELHGDLREEYSDKIQSMRGNTARSPLGWFVIGSGGVGKTHLLGAMRQEAARREAGFVLVDMTDVRDFWEVVLQGYLDSLQSLYLDDKYQYQILIHNFIRRVSPEDQAARNVERLSKKKTTALSEDVKRIVIALRMKHPREALEYQDVIRALICLNSTNLDVTNIGLSWLQGQEIDDESRAALGFTGKLRRPIEIVRALSWCMSLSGPTVVAFDQLDPIVQQVKHQAQGFGDHSTEEEGTARAIIEQIGGGLGAMIDTTYNTLTVVSCVESTFNLMNELVLSTYLDRFETHRRLQRPPNAEAYRMLIRERLAPAYQAASFEPPYETWPFSSKAIDQLKNESVREVLKLCEQHRKDCSTAKAVTELLSFDPTSAKPAEAPLESQADDRWEALDTKFENYRRQVKPDELLDEKADDYLLAPLYRTAFDCLIREHENEFPPHIDPIVEREFSGGKTTKPLHARLRIVDHSQDTREDHYCVRAIQRLNARAYVARLKPAMTQSGIDKALKFRHLIIVRSAAPPGGKATEALTRTFEQAGGRFHSPTENELRTLSALHRMQTENNPDLTAWLQERRPVSNLGLGEVLTMGTRFKTNGSTESAQVVPAPPPVEAAPAAVELKPPVAPGVTPPSPAIQPAARVTPKPAEVPESQTHQQTDLPFGRKIQALGDVGDVVSVPLSELTKHTLILGGSGSGKSVTVRRIVEEAALAGIPSIVVDCAQDMCLFNRSWGSPQEHWFEGDEQRAQKFLQQTEQIVWTPGSLASGNPLTLRPLPDFSPVNSDADELNDAVSMACDGLKDIVAKGNSQKAKSSFGVLRSSLEYFAKKYPSRGLKGYIDFLSELPAEAGMGVNNEQKLAKEISDNLKIEQTTNPLLKDVGSPLNPLVLFGDDKPSNKVRISVISLVKLKGQNSAHSFLNQLAMELFSWIKANPTPPNNRALRGLLVIDEARDFIPSAKSTECKESIMRLAAQARKYRLGLVFATQHPKDIETKIVGNCATHLYGLNNSPASLATLQDLMAQKGGSGQDIAKLKKGQFYIFNSEAGHKEPIKTQIPISLSYSPQNPLEENVIMDLATKSCEQLG